MKNYLPKGSLADIRSIKHKMTEEELMWYQDFCNAQRGDKAALNRIAPDQETARRLWQEICYDSNSHSRYQETKTHQRKSRYTLQDYINSPGIKESQMIRLIDRKTDASGNARRLINTRYQFEQEHEAKTKLARSEQNAQEAAEFEARLAKLRRA